MRKLSLAIFSAIALCIVGLPPINSEAASDFSATSEYGELQISVFPNHVEVKDEAGNTHFLSATDDGFVQVESFPNSGGYHSSVYDVEDQAVTPQEQAAYDELMAGITVMYSGDPGSGSGEIIIQSNPIIGLGNGDVSTQSWGCFSAMLKLAAAAAGVALACSGPQAGVACAAALAAYLAASIDYWTACGFFEIQ